MNLLETMNQILDYTESHLDGDFDFAMIGKIAGCAPSTFLRTFSFVTGISFAEYVRRRRLSLAAIDLQGDGTKVIDVALKYGYESPVSFTRAFRELHGITPAQAKKSGAELVSYPKLAFQLQLKGVVPMNYKIVEKPPIRMVGVKETVSTLDGQNFVRIPKIWSEAAANGICQKIFHLSAEEKKSVYGICANFRDKEFDYFIASSSNQPAPKGMEELLVPTSTWAVFPCSGPIPGSMQDVWKRIYSEWFPSSGYQHTSGPEIEWYSEGNMNAADYKSEIWIPVSRQ